MNGPSWCAACKAREDADWVAEKQRHRDWWTMPAWQRLRILAYEAGYDDGLQDALDPGDPGSAYNRGYDLGLAVGIALGHAETYTRRAA